MTDTPAHWVRRMGFAVGALALLGFAVWGARHFDGADWSRYGRPPGAIGIAIAATLWATIIPISAWAWRYLLADAGHRLRLIELAGILGVSNLGKYLPGNIAHHAGRVALGVAHGIPLPAVAATMAGESVLALVAAALVGGFGLLLANSDKVIWGLSLLSSSIPALVAVVLVGALLTVLAAQFLLPMAWRRWFSSYVPRPATLIRVLFAYCATFAVAGFGLVVLAYALLPLQVHDPLLLAGGFAFSWIVGTITPGAPAGLGVREGVLAGLLTNFYSDADTLLLVIGFRLASTLGDFLSFCVAYPLTKFR